MGFAFNFDGTALVLNNAQPLTFKGAWNTIKTRLIEAGEISEQGGIIQKVMSVSKGATAGETAGETVSALCAMDVSESVVAGEVVTTLTPTAAITFTPKVIALSAIAGTLGLDFGFRLGENLVNLYFGDDWDWQAPGIFDVAKDAIRTYIDKDGNTFYDDDTITAFGNRLNAIGAFDDGTITYPESVPAGSTFSTYPINDMLNDLITKFGRWSSLLEVCNTLLERKTITDLGGFSLLNVTTWSNNTWRAYLYSSNGNSNIYNLTNKGFKLTYGYDGFAWASLSSLNFDINSTEYEYQTIEKSSSGITVGSITHGTGHLKLNGSSVGSGAFINVGSITGGGIEGVEKQDGATIPTEFPLQIGYTYPNWLPHPLTTPDVETLTFPVELPNVVDDGVPATRPQDEAQTGVNDTPSQNPVIDWSIERVVVVNPDLEPEKTPTKDIGVTPTPPLPYVQGSGTGFISVYNPSMAVLSQFSQYLWSNDFLDNLKKLFSNPMDAIIGLHMIYVTPTRGTPNYIVCGYNRSNAFSDTVSNQYIEKSFGSIKINRYYNNILDFAPYTKIQIYLPYIGIVDLDTNELMGGTLTVKYRIDVLTGTCLARLIVKRGDYEGELYNFAGNCAIQLPISGGSYSNIIANSIGIAGSIGATIATGGALAPVLVGSAVSAVTNSHVNVSHSGSIGSNAGAMGVNIAYLIITRPKPHEANKYNAFYGKPSNKTVTLKTCSGYTRVKDVHIENVVATDNELTMIEELLKTGVLI